MPEPQYPDAYQRAVSRLLAQSDGKITYLEARPRLIRMGFSIPHVSDEEAFAIQARDFVLRKVRWLSEMARCVKGETVHGQA